MRIMTPKRLIASGIAMAGLGIGQAMVFVNIPFQDPTPVQAARADLHQTLSDTLIIAGLAAVLLGGLWGVYRWLRT
jgi:divalent metal cation (Fe/Co/Zn/Cd) transporter